jgi:hypothetical protein
MNNEWRPLPEDKSDGPKPLRYQCMGRPRGGRYCGAILDVPLSKCPACLKDDAEHLARLQAEREKAEADA